MLLLERFLFDRCTPPEQHTRGCVCCSRSHCRSASSRSHAPGACLQDQLRYCSEGALPDVGSFDESTARDKMALLRAWLTADAVSPLC